MLTYARFALIFLAPFALAATLSVSVSPVGGSLAIASDREEASAVEPGTISHMRFRGL